MPIWAWFRSSLVIWLLPLMAYTVTVFRNDQLLYGDGSPYWAASLKTDALLLLCMLVAVAAAAEGTRLRRANLIIVSSARLPVTRLAWPVAMVAVPTSLLLLIAVCSVGGAPAWQVWGTAVLSLVAWSAVGLAIGIWLPVVMALPAALVAAYLWVAVTPAIEPPWLRHMSGRWDGCCSLDTVPDPTVAWGSVVCSVGLIAVATVLIALRFHGRAGRLVLAAVLAVIVVGTGATAHGIAGDAGHLPRVPRLDRPICTGSEPRVCLWPERAPGLQPVADDVAAIIRHWRNLGIAVPATWSEAAQRTSKEVASARINVTAGPASYPETLAQGLVDGCQPPLGTVNEDELQEHDVLQWLIAHSSAPSPLPPPSPALEATLALPEAEQAALINTRLAQWWCP
ncbi:hypothetical protein [uncultured Tessaracoccus sp.]|uniref:DUF7224 domain-containing protein n=1 Tax=uncultured Tessaracoccus sp. TaxID=905023 RepID=UPI0026048A0F|nr:hypothetical protein [uncultured Tessaracoccus sp.]